jgi:predicted HTH domain antitoxin
MSVSLHEDLREDRVPEALACRLFADGVLSLGKAARLSGLTPETFIEKLGALGIPAVDYPPEELENEISV